MFGDYYGTYIGNDGKDDKKVYAVNKRDYKSLGNGKSSISKSKELKGITNEILLAFAATIHS